MLSADEKEVILESFYGGEDDDYQSCCRGYQVLSYLKRELECVDECLNDNIVPTEADKKLRSSLVEVINWVCDISENEDERVQEVVDNE